MGLERFVSTEERLRWAMVRHAFDARVSLKTMAARLGWSRDHVFKSAFDPNYSLTIDDLASWYFAVDGSLLKFSAVPR